MVSNSANNKTTQSIGWTEASFLLLMSAYWLCLLKHNQFPFSEFFIPFASSSLPLEEQKMKENR